MIELLENVRGRDCSCWQSTCVPTNDNLMEVLIMIDALKRASAARVTAAIPYFGYARQDREPALGARSDQRQGGGNMLEAVRVDRCSPWICTPTRFRDFSTCRWTTSTPRHPPGDLWKHGYEDLLVVSPTSAAWCARARWPSAGIGPGDYRQAPPKANDAEVMNIIGDVKGRTCVIMDDMVDTAGTLAKAAQALKSEGAVKVLAYCTHPVLSGGAWSASRIPRWTKWSSPTPFRCAKTRRIAARYACFRWSTCWRRRYCASATRTR